MANANLITLNNPRSAAAEAFRTLRTNLMFGDFGKALHTLLLTTPSNSTDKSQTVANLGVSFAQAGNRVIIVDGDLRRPAQHTIWGISNETGLTSMLNDDKAIADPPLVETDVKGLSILPSGPLPNVPADILSSPKMSEVIGVLKARADFVLFDAPPVLASTDATLIGRKVDGVLLAIRAGNTRRDHTSQAKTALERVNVNLLGCVLTNAPKERAQNY